MSIIFSQGCAISSAETVNDDLWGHYIVFVSNEDDNSISVINSTTDKIMFNITSIEKPGKMTPDPEGKNMYVVSGRDIVKMDIVSGTVIDRLAILDGSEFVVDIATAPDGKHIVIATNDGNPSAGGRIKIISTDPLSSKSNIDLSLKPTQILLGRDNSIFVITMERFGNYNTYFARYDLDTGRQVYNVKVIVGYDMALSSDGKLVYLVGNQIYSGNQGPSHLVMVNPDNGKVVSDTSCGITPTYITTSPNGTMVYVSDYMDDSLVTYDPSARAQVASVKVGRLPTEIDYGINGKKVYVLNSGDNTISVVDTHDNKAIATIGVGKKPADVVVCYIPYPISALLPFMPHSVSLTPMVSPSAYHPSPTPNNNDGGNKGGLGGICPMLPLFLLISLSVAGFALKKKK